MKKISILVLSTLFVFTCCTPQVSPDDESVTPSGREGNGSAITELVANVPAIEIEPDVKAAVSTAGSFSWELNDMIGFWPKASDLQYGSPQQCLFYVAQQSGSTRTHFESNGWGLIPKYRYYAYYPYDENATSSSVSISYRNQNQLSNGTTGHLASYEYLHASCIVTQENEVFDFDHLGSLARFILTFGPEYSSVVMKNVEFSVNTSLFTESAQYNPSSDNVSLTGKQTKNKMTLSLNGGNGFVINQNNQLVLYMMMSPAAWQGKTVNVSVTGAGDRVFTGTFTPTKNQVAGKGYSYSATMQTTATVTDLSSAESANCYIISAAGEYKFKAVKGNTNTALNAVSAQVIWESVGTSSAPSVGSIIDPTVTCMNGYIFFHTPATFKKGNALIAAKDSNGNIVWSWHIWCTEDPADEQYKNGAGFLMDRNLGALSKTGSLSCGLLYQWGRKDPFPGASSLALASPIAPFTTTTTFGMANNSSSTGTIAYATSHPTTFVKGNGTNFDWMYDGSTTERTWFKSSGNRKTAYDPCPPGYRVPDGSTGLASTQRGFFGTALVLNQNVTTTNYVFVTPAGNVVFDNNAIGMNIPLNSGGNAFIPACGCLDGSDLNAKYSGDHLFLWTNYPGGVDGAGTWHGEYSGVFDVNTAAPGNQPYNMRTGAGTLTVNWNSDRTSAKPVRCMLCN